MHLIKKIYLLTTIITMQWLIFPLGPWCIIQLACLCAMACIWLWLKELPKIKGLISFPVNCSLSSIQIKPKMDQKRLKNRNKKINRSRRIDRSILTEKIRLNRKKISIFDWKKIRSIDRLIAVKINRYF